MGGLTGVPRWVVVVLVAVALAIVGVGTYLVWPREASPLTEREAVDDFRTKDGAATSSSHREGDGPGARPEPGVYVYASTGSESARLGPLPAEDRVYPTTMTVTITHDGPACFTTSLNLLDQHTETTSYCLGSNGGLRVAGHTKHQRVGAFRPTADMTCDPAWLVAEAGGRGSLACRMSVSSGPIDVNAEVTGTGEVAESTVTVDGAPIATLSVDTTYEIRGSLSGTWREHVWFERERWLPVRIERWLDFGGVAHFRERSSLVLKRVTPLR